MAYFDSIKIGGTIKQVQVVQELNKLPSPVLETSPQLVKIGNDLYMRESKMGGAYGTYRFMLVPTNQQVYNVVFVSNGQTFGEIIINAAGEMIYNNTLVYSNGNWVNEKYKTIAIFNGNFTNALDSFLRNNTEKIIDGYFKYIKVSSEGGAGTTIIDITGLDEIPTQYQDAELLKTAILFDVDHLLRLTWIDDMYYYGNTDDFQYRYLSVDTNDFVIMRYDLQDIAKAPKIVDLNNFVPKTATQGTLERGALNVLQASNENYIVFNDEIFRLADKQHNAGYLVYSHNGHDTTGCFFQKCITITLSSRAWVLETQENQAKLTAGSNITIENNVISAENAITITNTLPEPNEENFEKGKIYTQGEFLQYISKVALSEPNLNQTNVLTGSGWSQYLGMAVAKVNDNVYLFGGVKNFGFNDPTNIIYKYNITDNILSKLTVTLPKTLGGMAAAAVGSDIYLFGGRTSGTTFNNSIYKFNTLNETIETLSATNVGVCSAVAAVGNDIYLFGGQTSSSATATTTSIKKYSTISNSISSVGTLPSKAALIAAAAVGSDIYLFGGCQSMVGGEINTIIKFETQTNAVNTLTVTLPKAIGGMAAAAVGSDIYLFGGVSANSAQNAIFKFNFSNNTIVELQTVLPLSALDIKAISYGDNVYLFGGSTSYSTSGSNGVNTINKAQFGFIYQYKTITAE